MSGHIWKRTVGEERPGDQFECCGCVKIYGREHVEPLSDGWYCLGCLSLGRVDVFESPALIEQAIKALEQRKSSGELKQTMPPSLFDMLAPLSGDPDAERLICKFCDVWAPMREATEAYEAHHPCLNAPHAPSKLES